MGTKGKQGKKTGGGGRSLASGMNFQARVGVWFAAHVMGEKSVSKRLALVGTPCSVVPERLEFETGKYLDDIAVYQDDGSEIHVQCKKKCPLGSSLDSAFGKTVQQVVQLLLDEETAKSGGNIEIVAKKAVLVVSKCTAPMEHLKKGLSYCRYDDQISWDGIKAKLVGKEEKSWDTFGKVIEQALLARKQCCDQALASASIKAARIFHIVQLDVENSSGPEWSEVTEIIESLYGNEESVSAVLNKLYSMIGEHSGTGNSFSHGGLLAALRDDGFNDIYSPRFDIDIRKLREQSNRMVERLSSHRFLLPDGRIPIRRECMDALEKSIEEDNLLITGEPGSGKTGILTSIAQKKLQDRDPLVFLPVSEYTGIRTPHDLQQELHLKHPLIDVLTKWPGSAKGYLIIDALDASRGGEALNIFKGLIKDVMNSCAGRWIVIVSIQSFYIQHGKELRNLFSGEPPIPENVETNLDAVQHFRLPLLSCKELISLINTSPELKGIIPSDSSKTPSFLKNIFNLSLAARLIAEKGPINGMQKISSQSELLVRYENERALDCFEMSDAVCKVIACMIEKRRMTIRKVDAARDNPKADALLSSGIMRETGIDHITFAHNILFDHAVGRFYLDWDDLGRFMAQIKDSSGLGLLLGPSFRYALERVWHHHGTDNLEVWKFLLKVYSEKDIDLVILSSIFRPIAEFIARPQDITKFCELLNNNVNTRECGGLLSFLARFRGIYISGEDWEIGDKAADISIEEAWIRIAKGAIETGSIDFSDGVHQILAQLSKTQYFINTDCNLGNICGEVSRKHLELLWKLDLSNQYPIRDAVNFVCKTYSSDPDASRVLLQKILRDPYFLQRANLDARVFVENRSEIIRIDPDLILEIYTAFFHRSYLQDGENPYAGMDSGRLPSNIERSQLYTTSERFLKDIFPELLKHFPEHATRVVGAINIENSTALSDRKRRRQSDHSPRNRYLQCLLEVSHWVFGCRIYSMY